MRFTLLDDKNEVIIAALTTCAAEYKKRSTVYITLSISIFKAKCLYTNVSKKKLINLSSRSIRLISFTLEFWLQSINSYGKRKAHFFFQQLYLTFYFDNCYL